MYCIFRLNCRVNLQFNLCKCEIMNNACCIYALASKFAEIVHSK